MIFYDGQGKQINISANVGVVGAAENNSMNLWPNPLELWRHNTEPYVIPLGTVATKEKLSVTDGTLTAQENYVRTWKAEIVAGDEIELGNVYYAFYDKNDTFISGGNSEGKGRVSVTAPENACFIRVMQWTLSTGDNGLTSSNGYPAVYFANAEQYGEYIPNPRSLVAKLYDPAYAHLKIVFSGDSNTAGAGLNDIEKTWCNLIGTKLQTMSEATYHNDASPSLIPGNVKLCGAKTGGGNFGGKTSYLEFDFNGMELNVCANVANNQIYDVYVDGELYTTHTVTGTTATAITFPDYTRKHLKIVPNTVESDAVVLGFSWTRVVEFENIGLSGANLMTLPTNGIEDCDLFVFMIGTNNRSGLYNNQFLEYGVLPTINKYKDKCIAILPPPRGYDEAMNTSGTDVGTDWVTEAYIHACFVDAYTRNGITYVDISAEMAMESARHYQTMLQDDLLHFSEEGHKILANVISAKLGVPTYYKLEAVATD